MSPETLYAVAAQVGPTLLLAFVLEARMTSVNGTRSAIAVLRFIVWGGIGGATMSSVLAMTSLAYPPSEAGETVIVGVIVWGMVAGFSALAAVLLLSLSTIDLTGMPQGLERSRIKRAAKEARRAQAKERRRAERERAERLADDEQPDED